MRRTLILTLAFLFLIPCVSFAGWFTDEPPDEWDNLPIIYLDKDQSCGCFLYVDSSKKKTGTLSDCNTFGLFRKTNERFFKSTGDVEKITWREGKKSGKWMLHVVSYKEETNRRTEMIFVFSLYNIKGNQTILAENFYLAGKKMPHSMMTSILSKWALELGESK
jgi:hypothetical protein